MYGVKVDSQGVMYTARCVLDDRSLHEIPGVFYPKGPCSGAVNRNILNCAKFGPKMILASLESAS